jgi:hypothetical protein
MMPVANKPFPKAGEIAAQQGSSVACMIDERVRGMDVVLPCSRGVACFAESGHGTAININGNFNECFRGGPPVMTAVPKNPEGSASKVGWINGHIKRYFGDSRLFEPQL